MITHPAAPLTEANEPHYAQMHEAREQLERATDASERIELRAIIGKASSEILRLKRKEPQKVKQKLQMTNAENIIRIAELTICTAPQGVRRDLQPLLDLAIAQVETIHEQAEQLAILRQRLAPCKPIDVATTTAATVEAYRETVP